MSVFVHTRRRQGIRAPLVGIGRRVDGAWLFADAGGAGGAFTGNAIRQWMGSSYAARDTDDPPGEVLDIESIQDAVRFANDDIWILFPDYAAHWDGTAWSFVEIDPSYAAAFFAFAALAPDDLYAVQAGLDNDHLRYWHWTGSAWSGPTTVDFSPTPVGTAGWNDADIAAGGVLRAAGESIVALTGTPTVEYTPDDSRVARLWANTSSDDWAVLRVPDTDGSVVVRGSGGTWAAMGTQPAYDVGEDRFYYGIHGALNPDTEATEAWIVGGLGSSGGTSFAFLVEQWDGTGWTRWTLEAPAATIRELLDVRVEAVDDVWVTGYERDALGAYTIRAFHFNGIAFSDRSPTS